MNKPKTMEERDINFAFKTQAHKQPKYSCSLNK